MAKRSTTAAESGGGKTTKVQEQDRRILATVRAIKGYADRLERTMSDPKTTLLEGAYGVKCELKLSGDVIVEASGTSTSKAKHTVGGDELLAALFACEGRPAIRKALKSAMTLVAKSRRADAPKTAASAKGEIDAAKGLVDECIAELAPDLGLWQEATTKPRAGAVRCKPAGAVNGTVSGEGVDYQIDAE